MNIAVVSLNEDLDVNPKFNFPPMQESGEGKVEVINRPDSSLDCQKENVSPTSDFEFVAFTNTLFEEDIDVFTANNDLPSITSAPPPSLLKDQPVVCNSANNEKVKNR